MSGQQALKGSRGTFFKMNPDDLTLVLKPGPFYDERVHLPVDPYLVADILDVGILHNVLVAKIGNKVFVVDGRQRVKAAIEARKTNPNIFVPVTLKEGDEARLLGMSLGANGIRQDDDPILRAKRMAGYNDVVGDVNKVGIKFRVSGQSVRQSLKLLSLAAPVQKALREQQLTTDAAKQFFGLSEEEQSEKLAALLEAGGAITARKVRNTRDDTKGDNGVPGQASKPRPGELKRMLQIIETPENEIEYEESEAYLLRWVLGLVTLETAARKVPWLRRAMSQTEREKAARKEKKDQRKKRTKKTEAEAEAQPEGE